MEEIYNCAEAIADYLVLCGEGDLAVNPIRQTNMRRHLESCIVCREEINEIQGRRDQR